MLQKTRGIVFRFTKYGETSIIVTIFTESFGLQSYIVNGVRSRSAKGHMALYQPLMLLDLVVYYKENVSILRIREVKCFYHYSSLLTDIRKSAQALFLGEMLNKVVKEQSHSHEICNFLFDSFEVLDRLPGHFENFHIIFLIKLSRFLGFGAHRPDELLAGGELPAEDQLVLQRLLVADYAQTLEITNHQRRSLLRVVLRFYAGHIENMGEIKSVQVLKEVFE